MSDLLDRLQDMVDFKHDDMDVAREAIEEITRLRAEQGKVRGYLSRLLQSLHPSIEILPDLIGVCTQIDNVLAGQREEIALLYAALATARRKGMEMPPEFLEWIKREMPSGTHIHNPEWWASRVWKAAIRAAAKEGKP